MPKSLTALSWPLSKLAEGLTELASLSHLLSARSAVQPLTPLAAEDSADLERWLSWAGARLGIEAEAVCTPLPECEAMLSTLGPALIQLPSAAEPQFLLVVKTRRGSLHLLDQQGRVQRYPAKQVYALLAAPYAAPLEEELAQLLRLAEVPQRRQSQVKAALLAKRLAGQSVHGFWLLRQPAGADFWQQLVHERLPWQLLAILAVFALIYGLEIGGWALIGQGAINGRLDFGWLMAWALLILLLVPLNLLGNWLDATFALHMGQLLKKRLLAGALRMELQTVKQQGVGQLLSRVMESQALEALALNGGFAVIIALIELVFAGLVLSKGAGGGLHAGLLLLWLLLTLGLCHRYFGRMQRWTLTRLSMTHALIERMIGHRTRLAQESAAQREQYEDQMLHTYLHSTQAMDHGILPILGVLSRGWLIVGLLGMAPAFIEGSAASASLAISLGGILLANRALSGAAMGLAALARAAIAWTQVAALFTAARQAPAKEAFFSSAQLAQSSPAPTARKLISASDLVYRYRQDAEPILRGVNLDIYAGQRLLLQGASGGGKSTLAAIIVGLRQPDSGLLLLQGLDQQTLGHTWQQLVTAAPQFHENHIFSGSVAFNLLMGRNWPATAADLAAAKSMCVELGLGELLERMPAGMMQMVGETGWQLSHGERSRIFLARALLQQAPLTVLDESFAALDPEALDKCLQCVFKHAQSLIVIAHP